MSDKARITPEITVDLHAWLVREAADQNRSLNGQVAYILQSYRRRKERAVAVLDPGSIVSIQKSLETDWGL